MFWFRLAVCVLLAWVVCYTATYGVWEWKSGSKGAACAVFAVCALAVVLPGFA